MVSKKEKLSSHTRMWLVFYWLIAKIATGAFLHPNAVLLEFQIRLGTCSGGYVSTKTNSVRRRVLLEDLCDHCHQLPVDFSPCIMAVSLHFRGVGFISCWDF